MNDTSSLLKDIRGLFDENNRMLLNEFDRRLDAKLDTKLNAKLGSLRTELLEQMDEQVEELTTVMNTTFDAIREQVGDHERRLARLEHVQA